MRVLFIPRYTFCSARIIFCCASEVHTGLQNTKFLTYASCIYFMQSIPHIGVNFSTQSVYECQHIVFNSCFFLNPSDDYGIMINKQVRKMELFGYHICNINVNVTDIK